MAEDLCTECGEPRVQPGRHAYRDLCLNCYNRSRYHADPSKQRRRTLKHRYNLTADRYRQILEDQDGGCALCGVPEPYPFGFRPDHDHTCCDVPVGIQRAMSCGECIRGLLCDACNRGLADFRDNPAVLRRAAEYLEAHS